jgi:repressor LexA
VFAIVGSAAALAGWTSASAYGEEEHVRELTARQSEILSFIRTFSDREGVPPTVREIGDRFKMTPRAAFDHLAALERKGALERRVTSRRSSRALVVSNRTAPVDSVMIPILGRVAAGVPLLAEENREGVLPVLASALAARDHELFALRVRGDSMIEAHIVEGDLVVVRRQEGAQDGDIVVALVDDEATVKRFRRQGQRVLLKPANRTMRPIVLGPDEKGLRILGKVIGLVRGDLGVRGRPDAPAILKRPCDGQTAPR